MTRKPSPIVTIERAEFEHVKRSLEGIRSRASNLLAICEAIDVRAGNEFAESMRIVRGLPPVKKGAEC